MQIFINIIVTLGLIFWASGVMFSPMMLGAPGASNRMETWWFFIILFLAPVVIFALYWAADGQFWGISGYALTKGFLIVFVLAMLAFNVPLSVWNIYKGIHNDGYSATSQGVYYDGALIDGADSNSFTEFDKVQTEFSANDYARDANNIYFRGQLIANTDPDTFRPIGEEHKLYYRDNDQVIYQGHTILGADANSFREAAPDSNYYRDKNRIFYIDQPLDGVRAEHFEVITHAGTSTGYGIERAGSQPKVFFYGKLIQGADGANFEYISEGEGFYGIDKNAVFYQETRVPNAEPECFSVYPNFNEYGLNSCEKNPAIFYRGKPLDGANPNTFKLIDLDHKLFTDENKAYIDGKEVFQNLDIDSLQIMQDRYVLDNNGAYISDTQNSQLIQGADPATFTALGKGYAKDKNHVYYYDYSSHAKVMNGADPSTFVVVSFTENVEYDAKDHQHEYRWGKQY